MITEFIVNMLAPFVNIINTILSIVPEQLRGIVIFILSGVLGTLTLDKDAKMRYVGIVILTFVYYLALSAVGIR